MHSIFWLIAHLEDGDAPADPRILGVLTSILIVSIVYNYEFWRTAYNLLWEAIQWLMSDDKVVLGLMTWMRF